MGVQKINISHWQWPALCLLTLAIFLWLQSPATLSDPDSFYHAGISVMMRDQGLIVDFPWTQSSLYKLFFIDHHFLYHVFLIPFVSIFNPLAGIKIATAIFATLSTLSVLWLLKKNNIKGLVWWLLIMLTNSLFLFRMSLGKAPSLTLLILIVSYYLINQYKYKSIFLWSWLFIWFYSAWPLLLVFTAITTTVESITDAYAVIKNTGSSLFSFFKLIIKNFFNKKNILLWASVILGLTVGLVTNPYFPTNLIYLKYLFTMSITPYYKIIQIGSEWYSWDLFEIMEHSALPILVWTLSSIFFFATLKKQEKFSLVSWLTSLVLIIMTMRARRQIEYMVPWLVISSALAWKDGLGKSSLHDLWKEFISWLPKILRKKIFIYIIGGYLLIILPLGVYKEVATTYTSLASGYKMSHLEKASTWLKNNAGVGEIVFNNSWSSFPMLFYYNPHNLYLTGLDQTFMYEFDKNKHQLWTEAVDGKRSDYYEIAKNEFHASWLLLEKKHPKSLYILNRDPRFQKVYQDDEAIIYKL